MVIRRELDLRRRLRGHPLRAVRRRDREDHDQPPGGAQRLPPGDADRGLRRARQGARGHDGRRDHPHRRGPARVLLRRRPARARRHRLRARAAHGVGRFHVTDLHVQIRRLPKPVVAMVAGYAIGGGHVLHLVCDLTIAADNARFGQTGPQVGSFDGGYGASLLCAPRRPEEGQGDLVPLPPVRRAAGARHGPRQHGRPARPSSRPRRSSGAARCSRSPPSPCG